MFWIMDKTYFQKETQNALRGYFKLIQNPTKSELKNGIYKPRLTMTKRFNTTGRHEATLAIEFSAPKLLYGNNFDELTENDFTLVVELLQSKLKEMGVHFFDVGVSGGVWGYKNGFALMAGGLSQNYKHIEPILKALSSGENYGLVGPNGAGHFVKMVHNGIEYGMMEAIGEGYGIMKESKMDLDLLQVTKIYQQGTVVRSWLIDLVRNIFEKEDLENTKGEIAMLGEGEWTVEAAKELGVDARVIEDSVKVRIESKDPKNQNKFSNKIVALLRKQFGGHKVN
jgi:6-phosphogluconate dehydrogenase (decarboxylating)